MNCAACTLDGNRVEMYLPDRLQYSCLFIGQAPGKTEVVTGQVFTGSAGKTLFRVMREADLFKRSLPQTNLIACKPPDDGKGNDRAPTALEIKCCHARLYHDIHEVQPQLIVALGSSASMALTGEGPITKVHGSFFPLQEEYEWECSVLCIYHPSYVMRQRMMIPVMVRDIMKVHSFFKEGGVPKRKEISFLLDPTAQQLKDYLYATKERVAFDTEATALNPRQAVLLGASFSRNDESAIAVYFQGGSKDPRFQVVKKWLECEGREKSTQNGNYDVEVCHSNGIQVKGVTFDTRLAEQLLSPDTPKDLNQLRAVYTEIQPYKPGKKEMAIIGTWGKERMLKYAALDAVCTKQVEVKQCDILSKGQHSLLRQHLVPVSIILAEMTRKGVKLDVPELAMRHKTLVQPMLQLEDEINAECGIRVSSPKQVMNYFDISSSDRKSLEAMVDRGHERKELIQKILKWRDLDTETKFYRSTFNHMESGRIHASFNPEGTGTGRLSSSDPNLQNVQEKMRAVFIPDGEDSVFISCDYKSMELRVLALLAPCEALWYDLNHGVDIHDNVKKEIYEYIPDRLKWNARWIAKSVVFGTIYGRSAASISEAFGVSRDTAGDWQEMCKGKYPGIEKYIKDRMNDFRTRGKVDTPYGRLRYVQTIPQAVNTPIQSTANDVMLTALRHLREEGLDVRISLHDEITIHAKVKSIKRDMHIMKEVMTAPVPELSNASFPVDTAIGRNWYEMVEPGCKHKWEVSKSTSESVCGKCKAKKEVYEEMRDLLE